MLNITMLTKGKHCLFQCRPIFEQAKAYLNTRRKLARTRFCLEPRRRLSAIFDNPNANYALRNGPDYTFLDKRPTPYGIMQYKRICQSIEHTAKIIQCNKEIELALELEKQRNEQIRAENQAILDSKLKAKGGTVGTSEKKMKP